MKAAARARQPAFLITIDTEGDNLWEKPRQIACRNAAYLPRFQALCERHGFRPTWLTNYEMAMDETFVGFGRDLLRRGTGEIGMHLHAWNSPPLVALTEDDFYCHPYLIEYPESQMREKIRIMTGLLEDRFGVKMRSHRAGRWAFNETYARLLIEHGYDSDCSVTPHVSWRRNKGAPGGPGGTDYRKFPAAPYFLDARDISRPGDSTLLEIPMSIRPGRLNRIAPWAYRLPIVRKLAWRMAPPLGWLRPNGRNLEAMQELVDTILQEKPSHLEFVLHSSEFMPGGSPVFPDEASIERLYAHLDALFGAIGRACVGRTLSEFRDEYGREPGRAQS